MKTDKKKINPQDTFAGSLDGIYLVDAGAGTGKTHTIIRRYENLINKGVHPKDILLITFTRNAYEKMRNDVVTKKFEKDVNITDLLEAPVLNFHAYCMRFLKKHGLNAPRILGINEMLTGNFNVAEESVYENEIFRKFYLAFRKNTFGKYGNIYKSLDDDYSPVLSIIKKLCSLGIFPTEKGWFGSGVELLKGNYNRYAEIFDKLNLEKASKNNNKEVQNDLYKIINKMRDNIFIDFDIDDWLEGCRVNEDLRDILFTDDEQGVFIEFIRDVYFSYIEFMLSRNILNFDFVIMFSFLILFSDDRVRVEAQFEYIMVDEFQDTDELQFLLLMLLCKDMNGRANLGVVGDWKQGIYGFRNTTIGNITQFSERLSEYKKLLNEDRQIITFGTGEELISKITFEFNYRSSQKILDFSLHALRCTGPGNDEPDYELINKNFSKALIAKRELEDITDVRFYEADKEDPDSEIELLLMKISELTNNDKYLIREFDSLGNVKEERRLKYSDICVLSRTNEFGLRLQKSGIEKGIPVNFEGGLELFASEQGILLLAWLRVMLNEKAVDGWVPILEKDGNKYNELKYLAKLIEKGKTDEEKNYFSELFSFRNKLVSENHGLINIIEKIFTRYGFDDAYSNAIITEFSNWTKSEILSPGELANLIDRLKRERFKVEINNTDDAVIFQTIHGVKGLEYPAVLLANMNLRVFPSSKNSTGEIYFNPVSGLRLRKQFGIINGYPGVFSNFRSEILNKMIKKIDYDEERRLLYVAVTRAKQYLYFTARKPSLFFTGLEEKSGIESVKDFKYDIIPVKFETEIPTEEIVLNVASEDEREFVSVHFLMEETDNKTALDESASAEGAYDETRNYSSDENESIPTYFTASNEAMAYGNKIHLAAQKLAYYTGIETGSSELQAITDFLKNCGADEIIPEADFLYPKGNKVIRGTIDLLLKYEDRIEIIDYKTDRSKKYIEKYKKQLGIYREAVSEIYPGKKITAKIFFTGLNEIVEV
ncbi:MAG: UvrD-helicase domain-containing protein [Bacteroidetes bacterium]|nr:UvrD-helicase domain-containing protein [Bacteroidota bacterium]